VIKYTALIVVTAMAAGMYVMSAFRRAADGPANAISPAEAGHYVPDVLYTANCAGCHGADGKGGAARGLLDPVFLDIADEATIRRVTAAGVPGTAMPPFAKASGGSLTDEQIDAIVRSIRAARTSAGAATYLKPPPYAASTAGDPGRGGEVFATFCARCHGADGRGGQGFQASSIVDAPYLALVSDQSLRTTVIAGRPDLGAPDWRGNVPGMPMSPDEVSDVVAWLAARRGMMR
jgi:mono/diheme cytochrome c family protein